MTRHSKSAFNRITEFGNQEHSSNCPDWLEQFAEKQLLKEATVTTKKTAVEVARQRCEKQPSIFELMSSIVSGAKPKFSSVEEVVADYQEKTGLGDYLKRKSELRIDNVAKKILAQTSLEDESEKQITTEKDLQGNTLPTPVGPTGQTLPSTPDDIKGDVLSADDGCSEEDVDDVNWDPKKKV